MNLTKQIYEFIQNIDISIVIFIFIQLLTVIISTIKSILTVNGTKHAAAFTNSVAYTFGAVVTKMITNQSFEVIIIVSMITNYIGVYFAKWLIDKNKKERLWTIMATIWTEQVDDIESALKSRGVKYTMMPAFNERILISMYSYSKGESSIISEILDKYDVKFTITENLTGF